MEGQRDARAVAKYPMVTRRIHSLIVTASILDMACSWSLGHAPAVLWRQCRPTINTQNLRKIQLPRTPRSTSTEVRAGMQQLSPSHLAKSLLAWTRQKPAREYAQEKVPVVHHEKYGVKEWNPAHRFVMSKFANAIEAIESNEILTDAVRFVEPPGPAPRSVVELVHAPEFVSAFIEGSLDPKAARKIGLPWSSGLVERTLYEVQGTLTAARLALEEGLACNNGGGTHHAFVDHGSGFTIFNDLAVTARALCTEGIVQKACPFPHRCLPVAAHPSSHHDINISKSEDS